MKNANLKNLWMQGLLMAVVIGTAIQLPDAAFAQLSTAASTSHDTVFAPVLKVINFISYVMGAVLCIGGVMKLRAHAENAQNNPLNHGIGRLAAGGGLLALPYVAGLLNQTSNTTLGGNQGTLTNFSF